MTGFARSRTVSLLVGGLSAATLLAALGGCASSTTSAGAGGSASVAVRTSAAAPTSSTAAAGASSSASTQSGSSASASSTATVAGSGTVATPKQQLSAVPAGEKLTGFDSVTASADGRTLYVQLESMGGACGQYDVVLQQSSAQIGVGLVHLTSGGHVCPQFVGPLRVSVALSAPLAGRTVLDLANDQSLNVG